ncbi:MAG: cytidine deaminase [Bacteroidales bacterium]|nr:cytidine deaminase [Bacteroidales bacterium]
MKKVRLAINYEEYSSIEEMDPKDQALVREAIEAQKGSYAPYSRFNVGAAVLLEDGTVVRGSNQENAAYPSGLCAERTAMFAAGANHPGKAMVSLAIVGGFGHSVSPTPCSPCGACRQVMAEYQTLGGKPLSVIMFGTEKAWKFARVDDILPFIFDSFNEK